MSKSRMELESAIKELHQLGYTEEMFRNLFNPRFIGNNLKVAAEQFDVNQHPERAVNCLRKIYRAIISNDNIDLVIPIFGVIPKIDGGGYS